MKIAYQNGKRILQLEHREVKMLIKNIRNMEVWIAKRNSELPEGIRPFKSINGEEPMRLLTEMELLEEHM